MSSIEHGVEPKKVYINSTLIFFVIHRLSEKITSIKRGWSSFCQYLKKGIEPVHNLGLSHFLASLNRGSKWKIVPLDEKWICTNLILATIPHICKNWGVNLSKDVKCHICLVIYTPCFLVCKCRIYHLCPIFTPLVFTNLRRICKEQICANPFSRPVFERRRCFLVVVHVVYALSTFWWELRCPRIRDQRRGRQRERPKHNRFN